MAQPGPEELVRMATQEMEYRVEMFNKLTHSCFEKCIEKKFNRDSDLNAGENSCVDRCVHKYWQVTAMVGQLLSAGNPPM